MPKNLFVSIVGRPNVGKSSLLNRLLGEKIAIVSDKPQTTRNRITGVLTEGETQYVLIDTPGLHKPRSKLGKFMVKQAGDSVSDVDAVILVTEWEGPVTGASVRSWRKSCGRSCCAICAMRFRMEPPS